MDVRRITQGTVAAVVFTLPVRVEGEVGKAIRQALAQWVEKGDRFFVFDLSHTHYMDSAGLGAMVSKIAAIRNRGGDIVIIHPTEFIQELLQVTNLNQVFRECENLNCAFQYFQKKLDQLSQAS